MPIVEFLLAIFVQPLMAIYSSVFDYFYDLSDSGGLSIILFGACVNIVLLPLYYQMEVSGREEVGNRASMLEEINRVKKYYAGREQYYYIKTIHRCYKYNTLSPVFSAVDLYFQVLIFATVYVFLNSIAVFEGIGFLFVHALSEPDALLGGINVLPLIMTSINVVSLIVYTGDRSKRIQGLGLALLFFVILYDSSAALLIYWTTNNIVSLIKNVVVVNVWPKAVVFLEKTGIKNLVMPQ